MMDSVAFCLAVYLYLIKVPELEDKIKEIETKIEDLVRKIK